MERGEEVFIKSCSLAGRHSEPMSTRGFWHISQVNQEVFEQRRSLADGRGTKSSSRRAMSNIEARWCLSKRQATLDRGTRLREPWKTGLPA